LFIKAAIGLPLLLFSQPVAFTAANLITIAAILFFLICSIITIPLLLVDDLLFSLDAQLSVKVAAGDNPGEVQTFIARGHTYADVLQTIEQEQLQYDALSRRKPSEVVLAFEAHPEPKVIKSGEVGKAFRVEDRLLAYLAPEMARGESQEMPILVDPDKNFSQVTAAQTEKVLHQEIEIVEIISEESQKYQEASRVEQEEPAVDMSGSPTAE